MVKKILFFGIAIILGIMVWMTSYYSFYMSNTQTMIYSAIENDDYDSLAKMFLPFYNKEEVDLGGNDDFKLVVYEGVIAEETKVTIDEQEQTTNRYQDALIFFVDNINFDLDGKKESDNAPIKNYTSLVFYNNDKSYEYTFNDPIDAVEGGEDTNRYYVSAAKELKFCEIDLSTKIIEEELDGAINKVEVKNAKGEIVGTITCDLNIDSDYFKEVDKLVSAYDTYLSDLDADKYMSFYNDWLETYNSNSNNGITMTDKERKPTSIYVKTVIVMVIYVGICGVLGYFILRKKNTKLPRPYQIDEINKKKQQAMKASVTEIKEDKKTESNLEVKTIEENKEEKVDEQSTVKEDK